VGLALTAALVLQARERGDAVARAQLDFQARQFAARLQLQFALKEEALRGLAGLFAASDEVTRREVRTPVDSPRLSERFPAVVEFRFARRVAQAERPAWRRQVARSVAAAFRPGRMIGALELAGLATRLEAAGKNSDWAAAT